MKCPKCKKRLAMNNETDVKTYYCRDCDEFYDTKEIEGGEKG